MRMIFTEKPEEEQWRMLQVYTYPKNIERYFVKNNIKYNPEAVSLISASLSQAEEYFNACRVTTLFTKPLLLYYGVTNLLYGINSLKTGIVNLINEHGMKISGEETAKRIADITLTPCNNKTGALSVFSKMFGFNDDICQTGTWLAEELFGSIPELIDDFLLCYENAKPFTIPVEKIVNKSSTFEKISRNYVERYNGENVFNDPLFENYLPPQTLENFYILRPKLNSKYNEDINISGRKHLSLSHFKNGRKVNLSIEIYVYMLLFLLSYLSRYRPVFWINFVRSDESGEKHIIEKFLSYTQRLMPNYLLNYLYNDQIIFSNKSQGVQDNSKLFTQLEIEGIIKEELREEIQQDRWKYE